MLQVRRLAAVLLSCLLPPLFLQTIWAHRHSDFTPAEPAIDLRPILELSARSQEQDAALFRQTGLSPAAIEQLLEQGEAGIQQILETQTAFFTPRLSTCRSLFPLRITCEERLDSPAPPLAPLEPGDLLVTFSTHTLGWRHGHAGLVVSGGQVLEASKPGTVSGCGAAELWRTYPSLLVLRVQDVSAQERMEVSQLALNRLDGTPYSLFSGLWGAKAPETETLRAQCAYLPWYAWAHTGFDLDSDGGRIVTVADLVNSPLLEVVQVWGLDPDLFWERRAK